jgi:hypothetical protein
MTRQRQPFLVDLAEARRLLGGHDPRDYGIQPIGGRGRGMKFYVREIRARLDSLAGLSAIAHPEVQTGTRVVVGDGEDDDGLAALRQRLGIPGHA